MLAIQVASWPMWAGLGDTGTGNRPFPAPFPPFRRSFTAEAVYKAGNGSHLGPTTNFPSFMSLTCVFLIKGGMFMCSKPEHICSRSHSASERSGWQRRARGSHPIDFFFFPPDRWRRIRFRRVGVRGDRSVGRSENARLVAASNGLHILRREDRPPFCFFC